MALLGSERYGLAWSGRAGPCAERQGQRGWARQGVVNKLYLSIGVRQGRARIGEARLGKERPCLAGLCKARIKGLKNRPFLIR